MANYRGAENIEFVSHGAWGDPDLIYDGLTFNYWDIEEALWDMFCENIEYTSGKSRIEIENEMDKYEDKFDKYVQEEAEYYLQDVIAGGYFAEGQTHWAERL